MRLEIWYRAYIMYLSQRPILIQLLRNGMKMYIVLQDQTTFSWVPGSQLKKAELGIVDFEPISSLHFP